MTIEELKEQDLIIFECISGSHAYGTNIETSDIDKRGVFILPLDDLLSNKYVDQVNDIKNDITYYEIGKFLELLKSNNPNLLELLNVPKDYITIKKDIFDIILKEKDKFITKQVKFSFGSYAHQQIKKARGLNKKIVNPVDKERKNPLDFCNVIKGNGTSSLVNWLKHNGLDQKFCGIVNIPNARDMYALYYDYASHNAFTKSLPSFPYPMKYEGDWILHNQEKWKKECLENKSFLNYKGIVKVHEDGNFPSNQLRLSSIPKDEQELCIFSFNQDGYTKYCKSYKEYWDWVEKRNEVRYNDNTKHGKGYDSKNMMHCHRLLDMAIEIGEGKGIIVRRPNREYLLSIRSGEMNYDVLVADAERKIELVDQIFDNSNLQEKISDEFVNELLLKVRKTFYKTMIIN